MLVAMLIILIFLLFALTVCISKYLKGEVVVWKTKYTNLYELIAETMESLLKKMC